MMKINENDIKYKKIRKHISYDWFLSKQEKHIFPITLHKEVVYDDIKERIIPSPPKEPDHE